MLTAQLAVLVIWFGIWTWWDYTETATKAEGDLEAGCALLSEHVLRSMGSIDSALQQAADLVNEVGIDGLKTDFASRWIQSMARALPTTAALFIHTPEGETVATSATPPPPPVNVADREYFQYLVNGKLGFGICRQKIGLIASHF